MEYCFTSEGSDKQPQASSLRGLDAATYYRYNGVLNCGHAVVRHLIMDSLHHWAEEYQVDGFCFVNAETLVQGQSLAFSWLVALTALCVQMQGYCVPHHLASSLQRVSASARCRLHKRFAGC